MQDLVIGELIPVAVVGEAFPVMCYLVIVGFGIGMQPCCCRIRMIHSSNVTCFLDNS